MLIQKILFFLLLSSPAYPQFYFYNSHYYDNPCLVEAGISSGIMNCLTDLGGKKGAGKGFTKDINWNQSHPAFGIFFRICWQQKIGVKIIATKGTISGSDELLKNDHSEAKHRFNRNLSFRSSIQEINATIEWYPDWQNAGSNRSKIRPYIFAGIGLFHFDPQTQVAGVWVRLAPLHTEGQGFKEYPHRRPYRLLQPGFPAGLGVCYDLSAVVSIRLECRNSFLLTDYLDDVSTTYIDAHYFATNLWEPAAAVARQVYEKQSQLMGRTPPHAGEKRGNPASKDSYFSIQIGIAYIFNRTRYH